MSLQNSKPPPNLLSELIEVSDASKALVEEIRKSNALPRDFPKDAVFDLCMGLSELHIGTAEGCRVPLEYARSRLPAIRRSFILKEMEGEPDDSEEPILVRGMPVDKALQALIAATTTALDEYRYLASQQTGDEISVDAAYDSKNIDKSKILEESHQVSIKIAKAGETLEAALNGSSSRADDLKRSVRDAENLNKLARSEIKQRAIVVRWLKSLSKRMRDAPKLIRALAQAIRVSADVLEPAAKYWNETESKLTDFFLDRYRKLGEALSEVASNLENSGSKVGNAELPTSADPDIDSGLEHWVVSFVDARSAGKEAVDASMFYAEVKHLTGLTSSDFARSKGYNTFKDLLRTLTLIELVPNGTSYLVKPKTGQSRQEALRNIRDRLIVRMFWPNAYLNNFDNGSVLNFDILTNRGAFPFDLLVSYLKLSRLTFAEMISSLPGLRKTSDEGGGEFLITDIDALLDKALPSRLINVLASLKKMRRQSNV